MNLLNVLEIIQGQRHDFLNHLQVISGFLQLNKLEHVQAYINRVSLELGHVSKTGEIQIPELAFTLLYCFHEAAKRKTTVALTVKSNFAACAVPGHVLGQTIEQVVSCALETIFLPEQENNCLEMIFAEQNKEYNCRLFFSAPAQADLRRLEQTLAEIEALLEPYGGRLNMTLANNETEVFFIFPRAEAKNN